RREQGRAASVGAAGGEELALALVALRDVEERPRRDRQREARAEPRARDAGVPAREGLAAVAEQTLGGRRARLAARGLRGERHGGDEGRGPHPDEARAQRHRSNGSPDSRRAEGVGVGRGPRAARGAGTGAAADALAEGSASGADGAEDGGSSA